MLEAGARGGITEAAGVLLASSEQQVPLASCVLLGFSPQ